MISVQKVKNNKIQEMKLIQAIMTILYIYFYIKILIMQKVNKYKQYKKNIKRQ